MSTSIFLLPVDIYFIRMLFPNRATTVPSAFRIYKIIVNFYTSTFSLACPSTFHPQSSSVIPVFCPAPKKTVKNAAAFPQKEVLCLVLFL